MKKFIEKKNLPDTTLKENSIKTEKKIHVLLAGFSMNGKQNFHRERKLIKIPLSTPVDFHSFPERVPIKRTGKLPKQRGKR